MSLQRVLIASQTSEIARPTSIHIASSSQVFVATHENNTNVVIWFFDLEISEEPCALRSHKNFVSSLATEGQYLLSGAHDKVVLWDLLQRQPVREFLYPPATAYSVLFWDSSTVISGHYDKLIRVWDRDTAECRLVLEGHTERYGVRHLAKYHDKLLSAAEDVRVWNIKTGECLQILTTEPDYIRSMAADDQIVAVSGKGKTVNVWDLRSGRLLSTLKAHERPIGVVQFDGNCIATGSADGSIALWSKETFELIHHILADEIESAKCGPGGCSTAVIDMVLNDGILLATGWAGFLKVAKLEQLPHFITLGEPFRSISKVRLFHGKGYAALHQEGHVCVEIWDLGTI